jgi:hypothetical protein
MKKRLSVILLVASGLLLFSRSVQAAEALCASVKMEIVQQLTLERQAFNARLVINNGLAGIHLTDVSVVMKFTTGTGAPVSFSSNPNATNNLFFVAAPSLSHIDTLSGGTVVGGTSAEINWLIIPAIGAASSTNADGTIYYVGATLTYKLNGEETVMEIAPDYIYVKPMPQLALDYFLPGKVYGDDAFTPDEVEPPVPFAFGLRVRNDGFGDVNKLKLVSSQPKIVANKLGLVVGMKLTGSSVQGAPVTPSLLLDFGRIPSLGAKMGYWEMEVTLSGTFTNFTAEISHADELGGQMTSLIPQENVKTHLFLKDVVVDLPGRDAVGDFLVDGDNTVYESDGMNSSVAKCSGACLVPGGAHRYTFELNSSTTQQMVYATVANPYPTGQVNRVQLKSVVRSDGKRIPASNVWLSKVREEGAIEWHYYFNLFDTGGTNFTYAVLFEDRYGGNQDPVLYPLGSRTAYPGQVFRLTVAAHDPDGTIPQISMISPVAEASFAMNPNVKDLAVGTLSWTPGLSDVSSSPYGFAFVASDGVLSSTGHCWIAVQALPDETNCPAWWLSRGVINTNAQANDYAAVNVGQVKYLAAMARDEFELLPGGANITQAFSAESNNYAVVNVGQLKQVAQPFYDRLGITNYPWSSSTNASQDYAMANIGQVKNLFSFEPLKDSDADGMPDWWERLYSSTATGLEPEADRNNDGDSNLKEYLQGSNPTITE